jgi:DNA helicase HerA-like ATPase
MTDPQEAVAAAKKALDDAEAALAAATKAATEAAKAEAAAEKPAAEKPAAATTGDAPLDDERVAGIRAGYAMEGAVLEMGALVNGEAMPDVPVRIPIAMTNRHGLVAGATGTGKTKTLQVLAEQLSAAGVPVFAADIKGDLSGIAVAGAGGEKLLARTEGIGQKWQGTAHPTEFYCLGGIGQGVPVRATVSSFGALMLAKVLGLNQTQESSLGLVFHYADINGLPLVDLTDLRTVIQFLTSPEGKADLAELGGLSKATAGVILRELITFAADGADVFFGQPEFDTAEFLRTTPDGRGVVSLLQVPGVADKPALFSTFLMWLLADLFNDLPEVGDIDKPKLVFFFDEAHLLFKDASKDFLAAITQTVRLIRSKGVGIFFVTQTPKDVPADVLAQLGSRVQHQLRAHTPDDQKALRATVRTYPNSGYDLEEVLMGLGIGEAIVTVMNEKGAPSPVAWTRLRAPQGSMDPAPSELITATVAASPLMATYGKAVDPQSAHEMLAARMNAAAEAEAARDAATQKDKAREEYEKALRDLQKGDRTRTRTTTRSPKPAPGVGEAVGDWIGSRSGQTVIREVVRGIFGTLGRR